MAQTYLNELACPAIMKPRNELPVGNGKGSSNRMPKAMVKKRTKLCHEILSYGKGYCDISCVHGVNNLTNPKRRNYERIIWLLLLIATTCTCLYVYYDLTDFYYAMRLHTVIEDSRAPIYIVPFPSVGICPRNRINWPKLLQAHPHFLSPNASDDAIKTFRQFFAILGDFHFGKFFHLKRLTEPELNLSLLADVNIQKVMEHVSFKCEEIFQQPCHWRQRAHDCCELFVMELTEYGFCFTFNSLVTKEDQEKQRNNRYYPYHNPDIGEGSGLDVFVNLDESKQPPNTTGADGIYVMVSRADNWKDNPTFIVGNTYTKVPVLPQSTLAEERTIAVEPEERKCLFDSESNHPLYTTLPGMAYVLSNCYSRCRQNYVFKYCKCNLDLCFPTHPSDNVTACMAQDYKCFYEHCELFNTEAHLAEQESAYIKVNNTVGMVCNCLSACKKLFYEKTFLNTPIGGLTSKNAMKQVHVDVHYTSTYMMAYRTEMHYNFVELLGSLGGIFSLFLGGSLMSAVEFFYYFTIGMYVHLINRGYISKRWYSVEKPTKSKISIFKQQNLLKQRKLLLETPKKQTPIFYIRS